MSGSAYRCPCGSSFVGGTYIGGASGRGQRGRRMAGTGRFKRRPKRRLTRWQQHVERTKAKHPGMSFSTALKVASKTYRRV